MSIVWWEISVAESIKVVLLLPDKVTQIVEYVISWELYWLSVLTIETIYWEVESGASPGLYLLKSPTWTRVCVVCEIEESD